ncbi:hypothetical protein [Egbenema bharatensis]|uniref:hypothetical protein n=1 Tax=Egbenema bharatensis TaxID=3463334 RepID=UPI003A88577B
MGRLHLKNIVLPAVLVSCATFSSFTLPFILSDSKPISINMPPLFEGEIQPVFNRENKGGAIRHIGLAIVSSVGAGLATVEILRRLQSAESDTPLSTQEENFCPPDQVYPTNHYVASDPGHKRSLVQVGASASNPFEGHGRMLADDGRSFPPSITENPLFIAAAEEFNLNPVAAVEEPSLEDLSIEELTIEEASKLLNTNAAAEVSPSMCSLISVLKHGQTCHIKTATSDHSQFALHWNQEYYRFFRVQPIREKALTIAQRLANRGEQVVITEQDQGFVVWVKESSASVELIS